MKPQRTAGQKRPFSALPWRLRVSAVNLLFSPEPQ